jgi:hypothetical protein
VRFGCTRAVAVGYSPVDSTNSALDKYDTLGRFTAFALSVVFLLAVGVGIFGFTGSIPVLPSAPGLSNADSEALEAPFVDLLAGRDAALAKRFVEGVDLTGLRAKLPLMRNLVPATAPTSKRLVQWFASSGPRGTSLSGVHERDYSDRVVRIETQLVKMGADSDWRLANFYVRSATKDELAINRLSLTGKPAIVVAVIAATFIALLFVWATALACLLIENVKWRWLWLPFILVGLTTLRMDTNGQWSFFPLSFQLFAGSFMWTGSAFQPWVFGVSVPIGAVLFWIARLRLKPAPEPQASF